MPYFIHPAPILIGGALLLPLMTRSSLRAVCRMLAPLLVLGAVLTNGGLVGEHAVLPWMGWSPVLGRVDGTATIFALALSGLVALVTLYVLGSAKKGELAAGWTAAAGALGVVYSGDWLGLLCFWSMLSLAPAFLNGSGAGPDNAGIGLRHALLQCAGAVALLVGILLRYRAAGDLAIEPLVMEQSGAASWLIVAGLGVGMAAFPFHFWLPSACGSASPFGAVAAVIGIPAALHACLRCCAGMGALVALGLVGALYALIQALRASDLRRLNAWMCINQSGFVLAAIGGGAPEQGVALHVPAFSLAACLLAMTADAIQRATGSIRLDELGGLFARTPVLFSMTFVACLAFAAAPMLGPAALPPAADRALLVPSCAAFCAMLIAVRLLFFLFFCKKGIAASVPEIVAFPVSVRLALGLTALLCVLAVTAPTASPRFVSLLLHGLKLFGAAVLAFAALRPLLVPQSTELPDLDQLYRRGGRVLLRGVRHLAARCEGELVGSLDRAARLIRRTVLSWREFEREWLAGALELLADAGFRALAGRWRRVREGPAGRVAVQALLPAALLGLTLLLYLAR